MMKFHADDFWAIAAAWHDSKLGLMFDDAEREHDPSKKLSEDDAETLGVRLQAMEHICHQYGLTTSKLLINEKRRELPKSAAEIHMIELVIRSELKDRLFLHIPSGRAAFYDNVSIIDDNAKACFPYAFQELRSASNCYAYEMENACVFHGMRALEHGLKALANDVSVVYDVQTWQTLLDQIESKIRDEGKKPNSPKKQERLQFLSEASAEFRHFKDAWRNYISHNKISYDETQARRVLEHVSSFIETLSKYLKEIP
ncbi:MAG: hypothetical protein AB7S92_00750 [Parvibaculaceae bacterium]